MGERQRVVLLSMIMSMPALAIDMMLPAFPAMREAFGLAPDATDVAAIVTTFFLGLAVGMLFYGTLADRFGRKPVLFVGFAIYGLGAIGAALSPSLGMLLVARFVWGFGAASPRTLTITIVRDLYEGDHMARVMSFVMAIFVMVPAVAPAIGRVIILVAPWRGVFWFAALFAAAVALWTTRLPETLTAENTIQITRRDIVLSLKKVLRSRETVGFTIVLTIAFGSFTAFLGSSEIIIREIYDLEAWFPLIFGAAAGVMGLVLLRNATLVARWGSRRLAHTAVVGYLIGGALLLAIGLATSGAPPLWAFLAGLGLLFVPFALLIPNLNALAMQPVGDVAGTAAAFIGFVSTAGGATMGAIIDQSFDGTVMPLAIGFAGAGLASLVVLLRLERGRLVLRQPRIGITTE
jgi:DHA1 family bicyclomycin/chloramphenicol resistance-like MFS transporter